MGLTGSTNEERIWNFLIGKGLSKAGAAGLMGNLYAESALNPKNLQNSYEKKLGYTDDSYTAAVDNGSYGNFVKDKAGYGLAQWTYWSRKQNMLEFARAAGKSIGDLEMQLDFLFKELTEGYKAVLSVLKTATTVKTASDSVLLNYERPADQSDAVKTKRASYGQTYYNKYAGATSQPGNGGTNMSNSGLVNCTVYSPNHSGKRTHALDTLTPHCVVGQLSAETIGACFPKGREASCNYGIGYDGRVCLIVDECNRSWCTSSNANDQRAITIECASDKTEPYAMKNAVYEKLIQLCADICKRNGKTKVLWLGSKEKTLAYTPKSNEMVLTAHRWFANKSCPGDWLYSRYGDLANRINALLGTDTATTPEQPTTPAGSTTTLPAVPFMVKVIIDDLNYRSEPSMNGKVKGQTGKGTFTIVEVKDGWGKLKSGAGWIYLENPKYCTVQAAAASNVALKVGDIVNFKGTKHYTSADAATGPSCKPGKAKITRIYNLGKSKHPYHLVAVNGGGSTVYGWVDAADITGKV